MKKIITLSVLLLLLIESSFSQGLSNWKHYYATPFSYIDLGDKITTMGAEELIEIDKSTLSITRIPFPDNVQSLNSHLSKQFYSNSMGNGWNPCLPASIARGPDQSVILSITCSGYDYYKWDGISWSVVTDYLGYPIDGISFLPYLGGSNFFYPSNNTLLKWDGSTLTTYNSSNSPISNINGIGTPITAPNDDIFLVSPYSINVNHNGSWSTYDTSYFHVHYIDALLNVVSPSNDYTFFSRIDTSLHTLHNSTGIWDSIRLPSFICHATYPISFMQINSATYDVNGNLWIAGDSVFCKFDGSQFYDYFNFIPNNIPTLQSITSMTNKIFLNNFYNQYIFDPSSLQTTDFIDNQAVLLDNTLYPSQKDNNGNLWFGSAGNNTSIRGVVKYNGSWNTVTIPYSTSMYNIYTIKKDTGQAILFGGNIGYGPLKLKDTAFSYLDSTHYYSPINDIAIDQNYHYWFGGSYNSLSGGVTEYYNGNVSFYNSPSLLTQLYAVECDSLNNKWMSFLDTSVADGIYKFDGTTWTSYNINNSSLPNDTCVKIIREGTSNKMWFCTSVGFARYWNGNWTIYNTSNTPLPGNHAEYIYFADDSTTWFCTMEGFASLKAGVWNVYTVANSQLHNSDCESILVDNNCTVWISTEHGLTSVRLPCGQAQGINVNGNVSKSDNTPAQSTMIYVYKLNSSGTDVKQIDNLFTDNLGEFTYYTTDTGKYYFEANVNTTVYPNQMIAYHDSALVIQQTPALHLVANGTYAANIKLKQTVTSSGSCTFNGKLSSSTERIGSVRLLLMLNGQPVASTLSNVNGTFKFTNIAPATYTVWVDKLGLNNAIAPSVIIDCANNNSTYPLTLFPDHLSIGTVYVASNNKDNTIAIYPNPFSSQTTIAFSEEQKNTTIKVLDITGREMRTISFTGKQYILEKGEMQAGIYFVQITNENNTINRKIIIQ